MDCGVNHSQKDIKSGLTEVFEILKQSKTNYFSISSSAKFKVEIIIDSKKALVEFKEGGTWCLPSAYQGMLITEVKITNFDSTTATFYLNQVVTF